MNHKQFLTVQEFFGGIFIDSYVYAMKDGGQVAGSIPTDYCQSPEAINSFFEKTYFDLNKNGYGIHFTPNGIKSLENKNRKHNVSHINAWYIDIDIAATKHIIDEGDSMRRQDEKERILGRVFDLDLHPSLTVETRNGFHLYWFALPVASVNTFETIQGKILYLFKDFGADEAACSVMHSLRVPYFKYYKDGEEGTVTPIEALSSLKLYSEKEMLDWLALYPVFSKRNVRVQNRVGPSLDEGTVYAINVFHNDKHGIFSRAKERPVKNLITRLSGSPSVNGDVFSFQKTGEGKFNILANGQITPNWIDESLNRIFSNNQPHFCTIHHFLEWYGHDNKALANVYRELNI